MQSSSPDRFRQCSPAVRPTEEFEPLFLELTGPIDVQLIEAGLVDLSSRLHSPFYRRRVGLIR